MQGTEGKRMPEHTDDLNRSIADLSASENFSLTRALINGEVKLENADELLAAVKPPPDLCDFLKEHLPENRIKDLIAEADISKSYIYGILQGKKYPERDVLMRIAFVLGFSADRTQKLILSGKKTRIEASTNKRDALILDCLVKQKTLAETNDLLAEKGFAPLSPIKDKFSDFIKKRIGKTPFIRVLENAKLNTSVILDQFARAGLEVVPESVDVILESGELFERNEVLRICFLLKLDTKDSQKLLRIFHRGYLNSDNSRDMLILNGLDTGKKLKDMDEVLRKNKLEPIYFES